MIEELLAAMGDLHSAGTADRLCEACVELLAIDAAAVSLIVEGVIVGTLGASGAGARLHDEVQFTYGEGPCLDAVASRASVVVVDLADPRENRWPAYGPAMLAHQVRCVYAIPIVVGGAYVGSLDLFQADPVLLTAEQVAGVVIVAELAQIPMLDLLDRRKTANKADRSAWEELNALTRDEVSQATGMLMAQLDIEAPAALVRLRAHAYVTGSSAAAVACDIVGRRLRLEPS